MTGSALTRHATLIALVLGSLMPSQTFAAVPPSERVDGGRILGTSVDDGSIRVFRGVPYAAPPVGRLRWRVPQPVRAWKGVRAADRPGPTCPQLASDITAGLTIDEDCLNLDIWAGPAGERQPRPVMVWFHGGARGAGAGSEPRFDGTALARKGVVVVTINYRGGPLGLLATPELSRESRHGGSGNYGLLDDIAALKWVQRNISVFGGDPKNVTIFGQSFGAGTSHFLSLSPLAKGLFHRMINQSHALYPRDPLISQVGMRYLTLKDAEADGQKFMKAAGTTSIADLRKMSWQAVIEAYRRTGSELAWTYVIDGYVLPRTFLETYTATAQADVSVLAGENSDESGAAADTAFDLVTSGRAQPPKNSIALLGLKGYRDYAQAKYGAMSDEFLNLYPATSAAQAFGSANAAIRDNGRISPWMWATAFTQKRTKPVYLYFFTKAPPGPNRDVTGAYHGAELRYVFNNPEATWGDEDRRVAELISTYWVNFARTGNPNGPGLPPWSAFDGKTEQTMELGKVFESVPLASEAKIAFWKRFYATQPAR